MKPTKWKKYKRSRFHFKEVRFAEDDLKRQGHSVSKLQARHSNYEWIWIEPIDGKQL